MRLMLINEELYLREPSSPDELLKIVSKFWNKNQWELYLKQCEGSKPKEEIYVGTTSDLEEFAARKSDRGFVPTSSVDGDIEF